MLFRSFAISQRLWNAAYDSLESEEELVGSYAKALETVLRFEASKDPASDDTNVTAELKDSSHRQIRMQKLVKLLLRRHTSRPIISAPLHLPTSSVTKHWFPKACNSHRILIEDMDHIDSYHLLYLSLQDVFELFGDCIEIFDIVVHRNSPEKEFALLCTKASPRQHMKSPRCV